MEDYPIRKQAWQFHTQGDACLRRPMKGW